MSGEDFANREHDLERLGRSLENGNNMLITAPRRVGKTSLLFRLGEQRAEDGWLVCYASAAKCYGSELRLVTAIAEALHERWPGVLDAVGRGTKDFLGRVRKVGAFGYTVELDDKPPPSWREMGAELIDAAAKRGQCLVLLDELAVFILALARDDVGGKRVRELLTWLRAQREEHRDAVRWVLAGSIGLDTVVARMGLSKTLGDLHVYDDLGAFDRADAVHLLEQLGVADGMPLEDSVCARICDRIGWLIPHHLQLAFSALRDRYSPGSPPPTVADVDEAYDTLLRPSRRVHFAPWVERLGEELGPPQDALAIRLLDGIAMSKSGLGRSELLARLGSAISDPDERERELSYLLHILVHDGYLARQGDVYRFRSPLLRDFWRKRYE